MATVSQTVQNQYGLLDSYSQHHPKEGVTYRLSRHSAVRDFYYNSNGVDTPVQNTLGTLPVDSAVYDPKYYYFDWRNTLNTSGGAYSSDYIPTRHASTIRVVFSMYVYQLNGGGDKFIIEDPTTPPPTVKYPGFRYLAGFIHGSENVSAEFPVTTNPTGTTVASGLPIPSIDALNGEIPISFFNGTKNSPALTEPNVLEFPVSGERFIFQLGIYDTNAAAPDETYAFPAADVSRDGYLFRLKIDYFLFFSSGPRVSGLLKNTGSGAELYTPYFNEMKTLTSIDNSVTFTPNPTTGELDLAAAGGGQVDSVVAGTGITVDATDPVNPIVTNAAPDQTVSLTAGTGMNITGIYPNFTITNALAGMEMPLGEIAFADATTPWLLNVTGTFPGTDNEVAPPTTLTTTNKMGGGAYFDMPANGQLRYIGTATQKMHCAISISGQVGAANKEWNLDLHQNATPIPLSVFRFENPTGSGSTAGLITVAYHVAVTLATNDYLHAYIGNISDTTDMNILNLNIVCMGTICE